MKHNPPAFPFGDDVRSLYLFDVKCMKCGRQQNIELDHIIGKVSNSAFNACPLCRKCHSGKTSKYKPWQLYLVAQFLIRNKYVITKKDLDFLRKYKSYYKKNGMGY